MSLPHPALLTDATLDAVYTEWRTHRLGNSRERDRMVSDAAARAVVEWVEQLGFDQPEFFSQPYWYKKAEWQALRTAVRLDGIAH